MASKKPKSLTALAQSLDTRKRQAPAGNEGVSRSQRELIENALRSKPVVPKASLPAKVVSPPAKVASPPAPAKVVSPPAKVVSPPVKVAAPLRPVTPVATMTRATALNSLQRAPSPAPARLPVPSKLPVSVKNAPPKGDPRRQYPRAEVHVRARLSLADDPERFFEATLPTVNLSVGGMFLESSFFLKIGTKLLVALQLPQKGREVKVKAEVVRVETTSTGPSGFALRFTEYLDGSQVTLATHFLSPVLREFLSQYAKEHRFEASAEYLSHTADVLAAWELKKAELGGDVWDLFSSAPRA